VPTAAWDPHRAGARSWPMAGRPRGEKAPAQKGPLGGGLMVENQRAARTQKKNSYCGPERHAALTVRNEFVTKNGCSIIP